MFVKWPLIRWQLRQARNFNLVVATTVAVYVCTRSEPFNSVWTFPWWFPGVHAALIAWFVGRSTSPAAGYLHLQGFSRDILWWHTVLSACGCVLWGWLPAALLILTPLRSAWQDLLGNPSFPYMGPAEHGAVWLALWEYAVCVPLALYAAARWAHPARGNGGGFLCAVALMVLLVSSLTSRRAWFTELSFEEHWWLYAATVFVPGAALLVGCQLFREREVQP
jgi:hypothetical protein